MLGRPHKQRQVLLKKKVFFKKMQQPRCSDGFALWKELLRPRSRCAVREVWVPTWRGFAMRSNGGAACRSQA